jgi:Cu(I)/Ag(I) efflux system membrane protein CusA/SilA
MPLGSEFMPPLDEGSLLVMPTTFPGISIEEARRALNAQHRIIMEFGEVPSVHGKTGRAISTPLCRCPSIRWPSRHPSAPASTCSTTGVRTPVGIKVFGPDLEGIERMSLELEGMLRQVPGTRSTFAERQSGREYIDIVPDRDASRYGLSVRDVHDLVETAIGGMPVSTVIDGRARYSVNMRYAADFRDDPRALRELPVPIPAAESLSFIAAGGTGRGSSQALRSQVQSRGGGMDAMGMGGGGTGSMDGMGAGAAAGLMDAPAGGGNVWERGLQAGTVVPLSALADVRVVTGPPMIRNENGTLVGYVFADFDSAQRDMGGWVNDAKAVVDQQLHLPPGFRIEWTGQYEFMEELQANLQTVIPLTLLLVIGLLYLSLRDWAQTWLVLLTVPFSVAGGIWLLALLDYNLSTSAWVGLIAVGGVAAQTGIVVMVYLDRAYRDALEQGRLQSRQDVDAAVIDGAMKCLRPMLMTVVTTTFGLMPLLWKTDVGADMSARIAAPVVGGMWFCMVLTLLVLPAAYAIWCHWQFSRSPSRAEAMS